MRTALAFPLSVSTTGLLVRWTCLRISLVFRLRSVTERMSSERLSGIESSCFEAPNIAPNLVVNNDVKCNRVDVPTQDLCVYHTLRELHRDREDPCSCS